MSADHVTGRHASLRQLEDDPRVVIRGRTRVLWASRAPG
jgi:hypothetical protein